MQKPFPFPGNRRDQLRASRVYKHGSHRPSMFKAKFNLKLLHSQDGRHLHFPSTGGGGKENKRQERKPGRCYCCPVRRRGKRRECDFWQPAFRPSSPGKSSGGGPSTTTHHPISISALRTRSPTSTHRLGGTEPEQPLPCAQPRAVQAKGGTKGPEWAGLSVPTGNDPGGEGSSLPKHRGCFFYLLCGRSGLKTRRRNSFSSGGGAEGGEPDEGVSSRATAACWSSRSKPLGEGSAAVSACNSKTAAGYARPTPGGERFRLAAGIQRQDPSGRGNSFRGRKRLLFPSRLSLAAIRSLREGRRIPTPQYLSPRSLSTRSFPSFSGRRARIRKPY